MTGEDCKAIFTSVACVYVRANVWKKAAALSRIAVYEVPSCSPPYRLVVTSAANGEVQINCPITAQLGAKRLRDDFLTFSIRYANDLLVSYGIQLKERKFAEQLLGALNSVTSGKAPQQQQQQQPPQGAPISAPAGAKKKGEFEISGPSHFRHQQHSGPPGGAGAAPSAALAQAMANLPAGWNAAQAPDGRIYYYNTVGETTWQRPGGAAGGAPGGGDAASSRQSTSNDPAVTAAAQRLLTSLPQTLARVDASQVHVAAAIGKGSYGTVYEGNWKGRAVAVKQLDVSKRQGTAEKSLKEFEVEARLMHRIPEHPNVLAILGILVALPQLSIVMEFMELTDLYAVLTSGDPISGSMEDMWIKGVGSGLRHVARTGIIHRDIAARNVLLNRDYHPKIADFGLAVAQEDNGPMEETALNKWLAPEAISERVYTFKSDVWSYGVTVWEIVTKQIPYPGLDPMMAAMRIVGEGLSPEIPADCHPVHAQVMRACFVSQQDNRASMEQVCQILGV